jgi:hypothetical protein
VDSDSSSWYSTPAEPSHVTPQAPQGLPIVDVGFIFTRHLNAAIVFAPNRSIKANTELSCTSVQGIVVIIVRPVSLDRNRCYRKLGTF